MDPQPRPIIPHEILIEHSEFIVHCSDLDYDYGYSVYLAASYSYDYYFNVNNWQRPPSDNGRGGDNRYDIYIYPPQDNARGQTFPDGEGDIRPSFIEIKPNINDNPSVTVAHEIFHSIQFGYAFTKLKPWFGECTATWMGVQVFPGTGEEMRFYFNPSFNQETPLSNPEYPMDHPGFYYEYANFIFAKFLVEWQNSPLIIKEIFERLANISTSNISEAIDLTLQEFYNSNFSEALLKFSEWKYFTGQNNDNLHFENADLFPAPTTDNTLDNFYIYSFGGCRFIVKATWQDLLVSFAAANNFTTWGALVIEDGVPDSSRSVRIILNSSGQGQTFARAIENNKVILIPVGIDLVYHESPRQQHGSFSTPNLPSRSPQFKNE